jgi:hypothetical protein
MCGDIDCIQGGSKNLYVLYPLEGGLMKGPLNREGVPILNGMAHSQPK